MPELTPSPQTPGNDDCDALRRQLAEAHTENARLQDNVQATARLRAMADAAPILLWETDQGGVTFVNQHYLDFFGASFDQIRAMGWSDFLHPDDLDGYVSAYLNGFTKRQPYAYECRFRRADGEYRWMRNTGAPVGEDRFAGGTVDISDLLDAQTALKQSEERVILEAVRNHAILTTDPAGTITSWSAGAQATFGWSAEEAIGQPADIIFTAEDRAAGVPARELAGAEHGGCADDERWHLTKADARVFMSGSVHLLPRDAQGRARGFIKIARDETQRREMETRHSALLQLSDHLRGMTDLGEMEFVASEIVARALNATAAGYATMDPDEDGFVIERDWCAPGIASIAGRHRMQGFGTYIHDLRNGRDVIIPDVRLDPRTSETVAALEGAGGRTFVNLPVVEHARLVAVFFVLGTTPRQWTGAELIFIRDAAERVRTAIERRRAEHQLRLLNTTLERQITERTNERNRMWDTSPDLMLVIDFAGVFRRVNPAWTTVLGYQPEELVGHHVNEFVLADFHDATVDAYTEAASGGQPRIVNVYRHKDGSTRWISWTAAPQGELTYATGRDITAERDRAAVLAETEEALRQSQKMEAVGQLTGGVAHDFNNLLTIIRSSVDFLRRPDLPDTRKTRYLDAVSETVERAAKLTGQLLAFARRQALKPEVFDVGAKLRGVADMLDTVTGARIRVTVEVAEQPCFVRADVSQFETALVNMAVNARDAMDGEGRLTLRVACGVPLPPIRGHAGSHSMFTSVSVTDTGAGIASDQLGQIFEPFFTTKEVGKGTGLGLSQVFGFAKQSGGDVDVESTLGAGTTFTLYLPEEQLERAGGPSDDAETALVPLGGGQHVLVVEDNLDVGQFCTQILEDLGYTTAWAANAEQALDMLGGDGNGFDVVFSDVVMPGMGGVALAETLRERLPKLPVVLASGYSHVLAQEGNHGFELLHKPYSADQLGRILQRAMAQPAKRRRVQAAR